MGGLSDEADDLSVDINNLLHFANFNEIITELHHLFLYRFIP